MGEEDSKNTVDAAVPASAAARKLSDNEKKALELADRAEHETGAKRTRFQAAAAEKASRTIDQ